MPIIASSKSNVDFKPLEPAMYIARCVGMYHLGTLDGTYQGQPIKQNKVRLTFELPTELKEFREGDGLKPHVISEEYTLSLNKGANLRAQLENWRGAPFKEEEAEAFDVTKLLGVACTINVIHKTRKDRTYAEIGSINPLMKGAICPPQINPSQIWEYSEPNWEIFKSLPDFIKDKIRSSEEFKALTEPVDGQDEVQVTGEVKDSQTLPF